MKYYLKDDFYFEITNGGASTGTEYGYVTIIFEKDGKEYELQFDIYQAAGGSETIDFIEIYWKEILKWQEDYSIWRNDGSLDRYRFKELIKDIEDNDLH